MYNFATSAGRLGGSCPCSLGCAWRCPGAQPSQASSKLAYVGVHDFRVSC